MPFAAPKDLTILKDRLPFQVPIDKQMSPWTPLLEA